MTDIELINGNPLCPHEAWVKIDSGTRRKCFHCGFVPPDNKPAVSDSPNDCTEHTVLMLDEIICRAESAKRSIKAMVDASARKDGKEYRWQCDSLKYAKRIDSQPKRESEKGNL